MTTAAASGNYERFVSGGSAAPVLLILALLMEWQLLRLADPLGSRVAYSIIATALIPLSVVVVALTVIRAISLAT